MRSDEAEAADAAGAAAMAEKLGDDHVPPPATPAAPPVSPFAAPPVSPFAAPRQQQAGPLRTLSGNKTGATKDDADLGKSLLDSDDGRDQLAGTEAMTMREASMMRRDMSAEIKRAAADGDLDVAEDLKAKKELPPLCAFPSSTAPVLTPAVTTTSSPSRAADMVHVPVEHHAVSPEPDVAHTDLVRV